MKTKTQARKLMCFTRHVYNHPPKNCSPGVNIHSTAVGQKARGGETVGDQQLVGAVVLDMLSPCRLLVL